MWAPSAGRGHVRLRHHRTTTAHVPGARWGAISSPTRAAATPTAPTHHRARLPRTQAHRRARDVEMEARRPHAVRTAPRPRRHAALAGRRAAAPCWPTHLRAAARGGAAHAHGSSGGSVVAPLLVEVMCCACAGGLGGGAVRPWVRRRMDVDASEYDGAERGGGGGGGGVWGRPQAPGRAGARHGPPGMLASRTEPLARVLTALACAPHWQAPRALQSMVVLMES
jgi:hypothetical protein